MSPRLPASRSPIFPRLGVFAAILGVGAGVWWLFQDDESQIAPHEQESPLQVEGLRSLVVRKNGQKLVEISARHVVVAPDGQSTTATGVEKSTLFRAGKPFLNIQAPRVSLQGTTNDLQADGGVRASNAQGFRVETARANWHHSAQELECPQPVRAWIKNLALEAPQMAYQTEKELILCPKPVKISTRGAVLRGQSLEIAVKTRQVTLRGGGELVFDPNVVRIPKKGASSKGAS